MRSSEELRQASGYADRSEDFEELVRILDSELRLITPSDRDGTASVASRTSLTPPPSPVVPPPSLTAGHFQLTHDYLVPSLREWLTRKQQESRRGRAELRLAERSAVWNDKPENRQLPSLWEFLNIACLTDREKWTAAQQKLMRKARQVLALRTTVAAALLIAVFVVLGRSTAIFKQGHWSNGSPRPISPKCPASSPSSRATANGRPDFCETSCSRHRQAPAADCMSTWRFCRRTVPEFRTCGTNCRFCRPRNLSSSAISSAATFRRRFSQRPSRNPFGKLLSEPARVTRRCWSNNGSRPPVPWRVLFPGTIAGPRSAPLSAIAW